MKKHNLDNHYAKGVSAHTRKTTVENVSEGQVLSFLESKRKGGDKGFQTCKILLLYPYNKGSVNTYGSLFWISKG